MLGNYKKSRAIAFLHLIFEALMISKNSILIVCNRVPYPLKDGGAMAMYAMIKSWHDTGRQVHLLAMNSSRHKVEAKNLPELFHQIASFEMVDTNTDIRLLPTLFNFAFSRKPQHCQRFYQQHFEKKLIQKIKQVQPDIVQLESIYLQTYSAAIRKHSKALLIQRLHNIEAEIWQRLASDTKSFFKKYYLKNLAQRINSYEHFVWNDCDALIPISKADAQQIKSSGCTTALCTIPFGIDIKSYKTSPSLSDMAYHIGAMDWQPNIDAMKWMRDEIVPEILKKTPSFQFQFAGRKMPDEMKHEMDASFRCMGEVSDAQNFIADKGILIVPLRSGSGIRIKTLEAMAMGKLVISTTIGIQGIEAENKVHFLLANDTAEFAEAISWCYQNKDAAASISSNAQALIRSEYNQTLLMQRLVDFVEKLS